jgi:hypothetical protein
MSLTGDRGYSVPEYAPVETGAEPHEIQSERSRDATLDKTVPRAIPRRLGCADHHEPRRASVDPALKEKRGETEPEDLSDNLSSNWASPPSL